MYPVSDEYIAAISETDITDYSAQHIRGTIYFPDGTETDITNAIEGSPRTEKRAMENDDTFAFGQMYVGSAEVTMRMSGVSSANFTGAELVLEFGVDIPNDDPEYIPLGRWDITGAEKLSVDRWKLTGMDCLNRLRKSTPSGYDKPNGFLWINRVMPHIEQECGVKFAQTAQQIAAMAHRAVQNVYTLTLPSSWWEYVRMIAEMVGGFAFANRDGEIEFRMFAKQPCRTIQASRRFNLKLAEVPFSVAGIRYTNENGQQFEKVTGDAAGSAVLGISCNLFLPIFADDLYTYYHSRIDFIADYFADASWYAGTADYYGDPSLDVGDMIAVSGGTAETTVNMLCCGLSWSFRAPQVITSAGIPDSGALGSTYSGGSYGSGTVTINQGERLSVIPLEVRHYDIYGTAFRLIASGVAAAKSKCEAFVNVGLILQGKTGGGTVQVRVLLDGIAQLLQPITSVHEGDKGTVFAAVPVTLEGGRHTIEIEVKGNAEITEANICIWGHDLSRESSDLPLTTDYEYYITNGKTTITKYIGEGTFPEIPAKFEGADTYVIDTESFVGTSVTAVEIPEGVVEIR